MNSNISPVDKFLFQFDARSRFLALIVIGLVILAWTGLLDKPSTEYIDQTLIRASLSFGAARALNSVISVAQSTTFSFSMVGGIALTAGEVLDPINDLVEQYSTLMKFSIGSLLIQKVLIDIVSDNAFNMLLTLSGGYTIYSIVFAKHSLLPLALKTFFFIAFLRFLLIVTLLLNSLISHSFIEPQTSSNVSNLDTMTKEVEEMTEDDRQNSLTDRLTASVNRLGRNIALSNIRARIEESSTNILQVMSLFIFETLLMPLLFLYFLSRGMKAFWNINLMARLPNSGAY